MATQNKITKATFKKFLKENDANLFIWAKSSFSGQTDCVEELDTTFKPAEKNGRAFRLYVRLSRFMVGRSIARLFQSLRKRDV